MELSEQRRRGPNTRLPPTAIVGGKESIDLLGRGTGEGEGEGVKNTTSTMGNDTYALLQDTAHETARLFREVFESRGGSVSVQTAHGNAKQGAACEELGVCLAETSALRKIR